MRSQLARRTCTRAYKSLWISPSDAAFISTIQESVLQNTYQKQVTDGLIRYDPIQFRTVKELDRLYNEIIEYGGPQPYEIEKSSTSSSWWKNWTGTKCEQAMVVPPQSIYLHGGVGCGKVGYTGISISQRTHDLYSRHL